MKWSLTSTSSLSKRHGTRKWSSLDVLEWLPWADLTKNAGHVPLVLRRFKHIEAPYLIISGIHMFAIVTNTLNATYTDVFYKFYACSAQIREPVQLESQYLESL